MKPLITVIEPEGPETWFSPLKEHFEVEFFYPHGPVAPEKVSEILSRSYGVIITSATAVTNEQLDEARCLKIIAKCGGAPSNIDVFYAARCGVAVSCVPGANSSSIAEYTVMLIIAGLRRFDLHSAAVRNGEWRSACSLLGHDLRCATVGIVGLGAIGKEVVKRLAPFECKILAYSPHAERNFSAENFRFIDSLDAMLPLCDVVSLHCRVTEATKGFFGREKFSLMKPGTIFINTARGALVDEAALADALKNGPLGAAAVDVFELEPPDADNPLLSCPNVILTPHSSGWTEEVLKRECVGAVKSVLAIFKGEPIPGLLNEEYSKYPR